MNDQRRSDLASQQLERVLGFFPRVEAKISTLFAVNAGMMGVLAVNAKLADLAYWHMGGAYLLTLACLAASFLCLYWASHPNLDGGDGSLIYFKSIGERREAKYIEEVNDLTEARWQEDLLGQIWRNSQILTEKYKNVRRASFFTAVALLPWFISLVLAASYHQTFTR